jgi:hypothetical protein
VAGGPELGTHVLPEPYHVLVSEAMLQQTQVATVVPYFKRFLDRFPTLTSLAGSDEQDVLRLWQGLGYYSRARNLRQGRARPSSNDFDGAIPSDVPSLLKLPGVGRYNRRRDRVDRVRDAGRRSSTATSRESCAGSTRSRPTRATSRRSNCSGRAPNRFCRTTGWAISTAR